MGKFNMLDKVKLKSRRALKSSEIIGSGWAGSPAYLPDHAIGVVLEVVHTFPPSYKIEFPINERWHALMEVREHELELVEHGAAGTW